MTFNEFIKIKIVITSLWLHTEGDKSAERAFSRKK